jgi:hypothetical protein
VAAAEAKAHGKRPDIVLYINGIALGVLELKRSIVSVAEGIRQNLDNQNLQRRGPPRLAEPRTGEEAAAVLGIHCRPRACAPDRAPPQRPLPRHHG